MEEIAVLTEEVAMELIARGFELRGHEVGEYLEIWYFKDGVEIEREYNNILKKYFQKNLTEEKNYGNILLQNQENCIL